MYLFGTFLEQYGNIGIGYRPIDLYHGEIMFNDSWGVVYKKVN